MSNPNAQPQTPGNLRAEYTSVQNYLNILQGVIARMATSSSNCKTWCISLVSAILVVIADKSKPNYAWICLIPIVLFFLLDAYYLGQERSFRDIYNDFIQKLQSGNAETQDLFVLKPLKGFNVVKSLYKASFSFSVYPFYFTLVVTVIYCPLSHFVIVNKCGSIVFVMLMFVMNILGWLRSLKAPKIHNCSSWQHSKADRPVSRQVNKVFNTL